MQQFFNKKYIFFFENPLIFSTHTSLQIHERRHIGYTYRTNTSCMYTLWGPLIHISTFLHKKRLNYMEANYNPATEWYACLGYLLQCTLAIMCNELAMMMSWNLLYNNTGLLNVLTGSEGLGSAALTMARQKFLFYLKKSIVFTCCLHKEEFHLEGKRKISKKADFKCSSVTGIMLTIQ